ncbi:MAG TPA: T9SS type A sorting domain-containing protein [Bacteroidales bacterium]|nr:T9SS type A sorting domain-containing protein [Bacteroidales bacterium]
MKKAFAIFLVFISCMSFSQNYKLFTPSSKKLFIDFPAPIRTYSMSFDMVDVVNSDTVYYNFMLLNDIPFGGDSCHFISYFCHQQKTPSWAGAKMLHDNNSAYKFFNLSGDTLHFDFNTNPADTQVFFQDASQKFLFVYQNSDTLGVFGNADSARYYTIMHADPGGNTISSPLNQQNIIISKNFGLMRFFQIDSFPQVLKPLTLIGNVSPAGGLTEVTDEMIYDYQPGDEFQYHEAYYQQGGPPFYNYSRYVKYFILSRTETTDSVIYSAVKEYFYADSLILHVDTVQLKYYRHIVLAQIPFEKPVGNSIKRLGLVDYCGMKLWTLYNNSDSYFHEYCALDTSWCVNSEPGPPVISHTVLVAGLGMYYSSSSVTYMPPYGWGRHSDMVYFKKNAISCGSMVTAGINDSLDICKLLSIHPNPAKDMLNITSLVPLKNMNLFNPEGQMVLTKTLSGTNETIDIRQLNAGVYFALFSFCDNRIVTRKIIILD